MGIIIVLYTAKIKLKTLESQGLAYHKYSIHGHYNYNFNYHTLLQCCAAQSLAQQVHRTRAPYSWLCRVTCLGTVFSMAPLHLPPPSTMPALDQNTIFPLNLDDSFIFPNAGLISPRHSPLSARFVEVTWVGSLSAIYESVLAGPESAWLVTYS